MPPTLRIHLDLENDAFALATVRHRAVYRILRDLSEHVLEVPRSLDTGAAGLLTDGNGNVVGAWEVEA